MATPFSSSVKSEHTPLEAVLPAKEQRDKKAFLHFVIDNRCYFSNEYYYQIMNCELEKKVEANVLKAMQEAGKPVRPGDVAKTLGVDSKEVSKAIKSLRESGKVISPKRCYYEPA